MATGAPTSTFVQITREQFETLQGYITNLQIEGFDVHHYGEGKKAGISAVPEEVGGSGSGTSLYIAKIVSGTGQNHTADIYSNIDKTATETGVTLKILQIDSGESIPADTYLPCWQQEWGTAGSETTEWTSDIARSY